MSIKLTAVIPVYALRINTMIMGYTKKCVFSVSPLVDNVIIVDDGSEQSLGWAEFDFDNVSIVKNDTNRGYTESINKGIELAKASGSTHIAVINNDTEVLRGNLKYLCTDYYTFPKIDGKEKPLWDGAFFCFPVAIWKGDDPQFRNYFGDLDRFYDPSVSKLIYKDDIVVKHYEEQTSRPLGIREKDYALGMHRFEEKWGVSVEAAYRGIDRKFL